MTILSRRQFLGASALAASSIREARADEAKRDFAFFLVGDTHYLADKESPDKMDSLSAGTNARLIDVLNRLPGTAIPEAAGGGTVETPRGLIHAGDLIDSGDKNGGAYPKMHQTEWAAFNTDYGHTGKDGRLKFPVYEVHGNHDSPPGDGLIVQKITERNKTRPGVTNVSKNGLHYSWDWDGVHFVNLGIVVGAVKAVTRKRRYNPLESLDFLAADLADKVGTSGRPVVITHHVDMVRYSTPPNPDVPMTNPEWDPADVRGYFDALTAYNVVAILYGHTHARNVYQWDGSPKKGDKGFPVFNVDNSAHYGMKQQALFYFHLRGDDMTVRELATPDRWETAAWTPQTWTRKIAAKKA